MSAKPRTTRERGWRISLVAAIVFPVIFMAVYGGKDIARFVSTPRSSTASANADAGRPPVPERKSLDAFGKQPLAFEPNLGQVNPQVRYLARGQGYTLFLTANEAVFSRHSQLPDCTPIWWHLKTPSCLYSSSVNQRLPADAIVRMQLIGTWPAIFVPQQPLPGLSNYFVGNRRAWRTGVPQYGRVRMLGLYPGIDVEYHGAERPNEQQVEFDFHVAPGADPRPIRLHFSGADEVAVDDAGNLVVSSLEGNLLLHRAFAYQVRDGVRESVEANYVLKPGGQVGFLLGSYDHDRELVIDPALSYCTYLGGAGEDEAASIAVDSAGNAYVTGTTESPDFPADSGTLSAGGGFDVFVTKLNAAGSTVLYTTLIGGDADEIGNAIAVDGNGNAYVAGITTSSNFPATAGVLQSALRGPQDGFVAKLSPNGTLAYSTYLGGSGSDSALGLALDASGDVYIGGETLSTDFPGASSSPIQFSNSDGHAGFVAKLNPTGSALAFATYLGGSNADLVTGVALDASNNVYAAGITLSPDYPTTTGALQTKCGSDGNCDSGFDDGFVTAIKADGSGILYSTFLGGSGTDDVLGVAVCKSTGEAYVAGVTNSKDFPKVNTAQSSPGGGDDAFVAKLNASGSGLLFSTYLGGSGDDAATGIALDAFHDAYITGRTLSADFPTASAFQSNNGGADGSSDAFVTELNSIGGLVYSSYLGGAGNENAFSGQVALGALGAVAVDAASNAYLAGSTASTTGFPTTQLPLAGTYSGGLADAFVAKITAAPADFLVSATPATATVAAGASAMYTVTINPVNSAFGNAVALSCSGLPLFATCGFANASLTPGSASATTTLTISTGLAIARSMPPRHVLPPYYSVLPSLAGMGLVGLIFADLSPSKKRLAPWIASGFLILLAIFLVGCASSPSAGGGSGGTVSPGSYNVTIVGTSGSVTRSAAVTIVVQ